MATTKKPAAGKAATTKKTVPEKAVSKKAGSEKVAFSRETSRTAATGEGVAKKAAPKKAAAKKAVSKKSSAKEDNYTRPALRERLKAKVMAGEKGGGAGQWSARKSQLLTHEYEAAGGGYKSYKRTAAQKSLKSWTDEKWTTSDGKPAGRGKGTTRYLPEKAWDALSAEEKKATNIKKVKTSKEGRQTVPNTEKAAAARKKAVRQNLAK